MCVYVFKCVYLLYTHTYIYIYVENVVWNSLQLMGLKGERQILCSKEETGDLCWECMSTHRVIRAA